MILSQRANKIEPSGTNAVTQRIRDLKRQGKDVLAFSSGEPDFPTPEHIALAGHEAINKGFTKYPPTTGLPELREAIRDHLEEYYHIAYEPGQVIVTVGAKQALIEVMMALLDPGDEVIIPVPCWVSYPEQVKLADGVPILIERKVEDNFRLRPEQVAEKITPRTKLMIFCNPDNPTGTVMQEEDIRGIAELALKHRFYVISDEIYSRLTYDGRTHTAFAGISEKVKQLTITVNGFSKAYAMTGWRLGYAAGPDDVIRAGRALRPFGVRRTRWSSCGWNMTGEGKTWCGNCKPWRGLTATSRRAPSTCTRTSLPGTAANLAEGRLGVPWISAGQCWTRRA
ncbi:MAG: pyridoxal phosphate-dependent aminotransferase [Deltaproteobacteria bacterium]|nr:pyridoxal phosphate-dependent aminotransferase [Deltaproteobacteria bacterium]